MRPCLSLIAAVALIGCATPQEQCKRDISTNLLELRALIADTQANIDRGYGLQTVTQPRSILVACVRNHSLSFCQDRQVTTKLQPVALDLDLERKKLRQLQDRQAQAASAYEAQIAQCVSKFPT